MKTSFLATIRKGSICPINASIGRVAVDLSRFKDSEVLEVTVQSQTKKRTLKQNARYWKLIVPAFANWTGYEQFPESAEKLGLAPKDSAHEVLKAMFIPEREAVLPDGSTVKIRPSTAKLTTAEMADLQDKAERFLNDQGIYLAADERFVT